MKSQASVSLILFLCLLLMVFSIVFSTGKFVCIDLLPACVSSEGHVTSSNPGTPPQTGASRAEILAEMLAIGALNKGFTEWYVAANGTQSGKGSVGSPLDLTTALSGGTQSARIKPGDLVWIRGGRYTGSFIATAAGTVDAPIHFRQHPGERAILEKTEASREVSTLSVRSPYVWFWDLEITNSFTSRQRLDPEGELNPWRGSGINVWAPNTKYINLVIHDNGHGFGLWNEDGGTEIYGCLIYNNGNNKKEHGIYAHNKIGTQVFADNVIFNNAGYGLHIYANSIKSSISGFNIQGNVIFNNGALTGSDQVADQILVGGVRGVPAARITVQQNFVYNSSDAPTSKSRGVRLGYEDQNNLDVALIDNHILSKVPLKILWWEAVKVRGNTVVSRDRTVEIETPPTSDDVGSSRVDLQACKLEYSIVSPK